MRKCENANNKMIRSFILRCVLLLTWIHCVYSRDDWRILYQPAHAGAQYRYQTTRVIGAHEVPDLLQEKIRDGRLAEAIRMLKNAKIVDKYTGTVYTVDDVGNLILEPTTPQPNLAPQQGPAGHGTNQQMNGQGPAGHGTNQQMNGQAWNRQHPVQAASSHINPIEYTLTRWTEWGPCNNTCGAGYQSRTRSNRLGTAEVRRCVQVKCEDGDYGFPGGIESEKGSSPWPMLFGMLLMFFIILSGVGVYFLVTKGCQNDGKPFGSINRGPLPPTPDEGKRASKKKDKKKAGRKPSKTKNVKKKVVDSDTESEDGRNKLRLLSSDDEENPYLEISEIHPPGSDYEISQLRDAPLPPSKHYLENEEEDPAAEEGLYESPMMDDMEPEPDEQQEPDYMEFE